MARGNTHTSYGSVAKSFHWLTALLILSAIPLGIVANGLAHQIEDPNISATDADLARAALLFSLHKTIGVAIFFVALARILWAVSQPKPGLLNGDNAPEAFAAETVHWLLYGSLVAVPLTGWIHHAATTGFAPIWWPFGQSLPFVPKDVALAEVTATLHYLLQWVLIGAIALHIAGAIKHHVIDQDATLRRMLPGRTEAAPTAAQPGHMLPLVSALIVWLAVLGGAASLGWFGHTDGKKTAALEAVESEWQVQDGALNITIRQMGSEVSGSFADWTADITYSEMPDSEGQHGDVRVNVSIGSLTLGSVATQAMGADYFDVTAHPTATFEATIVAVEDGHLARGTLTIRDKTVPVEMPFTLALEESTAMAKGRLTVDRRDFGIGLGTKDENTLGFSVDIQFELTAARQ